MVRCERQPQYRSDHAAPVQNVTSAMINRQKSPVQPVPVKWRVFDSCLKFKTTAIPPNRCHSEILHQLKTQTTGLLVGCLIT